MQGTEKLPGSLGLLNLEVDFLDSGSTLIDQHRRFMFL